MTTSPVAKPAVELDELAFLNREQALKLAHEFGTPAYVYSAKVLTHQARKALSLNVPFGLTVRYAMKANPLARILQLFNDLDIHIDASSGYEVHRAIKAGINPKRIMLTSQELPRDLNELVRQGVIFNATSLHQLEEYGRQFRGHNVSVRVNCGLGSGHSRSVSVAGPSSSFGIWHEQLEEIIAISHKYNLAITTLHSHIGCGADTDVWLAAAQKTLSVIEALPQVETLNLGGGFKVARMRSEVATDMDQLGHQLQDMLMEFYQRTSRKLRLEIEPGTFLTANAGTLLASVQDIVTTGTHGFTFMKLDTGMNDFMRPALYGSQHPIIVVNDTLNYQEYVVVGHTCESGDLLTPFPGEPARPLPRLLRRAMIGDLIAIEGAGAYCSSMRAIGYNSFPSPSEILIDADGSAHVIG